jgi:hypothetical protein
MSYEIIFWGNSYDSIKIFTMQTRVIIMGHGNRDTCRNSFKELKILPFISQYIFSLLVFVVNNIDQFLINSEIHSSINTRQGSNLHLPLVNLDIYQKGVHYSGIKVFNSLPSSIKVFFDNPKTFKMVFKISIYKFLLFINEYYNNNRNN